MSRAGLTAERPSGPDERPVRAHAPARARRWGGRRDGWQAWLYLLPTVVGLCLFSAGAIVASFLLSFTDFNSVNPPRWIWLGNYRDLAREATFWQVVRNTVVYALGFVPSSVVLSLLLSLLVNQKLRAIVAFRSVYFLPVVSSTVAVAMVWGWLYNPQFGLINYLLFAILHVDGPNWLASTEWALPALIVMAVWKSLGYNMVIFLAGLQGIPAELYEAAKIDGAGRVQQLWRITLPLLSPTTFFVLIITVIGSFQIFDQTYVMTQGGPANATLTLSYYIYENAFEWFHMGYAAALAYVLFFLVLAFTLLQVRWQRRWVFYR